MPEISSLEQYRAQVRQGRPCLFEFLTREEFQLCWAVAFVNNDEEYQREFPLADYGTPGSDGDTWDERFRRAIRYLADHGWCFKGLNLDGWEIMGEMPPVQPKNLAYHIIFESGSMPSPIIALHGAIPLFRGVLGMQHEAEMLEDALEGVRAAKAHLFPATEVM